MTAGPDAVATAGPDAVATAGPDAVATAGALLAARRDRRPAGPLPPALRPRDEVAGVAAQLALAQLLGCVPPAGFKLGATGGRMRAYLGVSEPIAGFMRAADLHVSGVTLPFDGFRRVGVECEIAVRLVADLPPGPCDAMRAAQAVGSVMAAIEIVENRYDPPGGDLAAMGAATLIADQMFHAAAVLGAEQPLGDLDLAAILGEIALDGVRIDGGAGAELLGHPMAALAWLAGSREAASFGGLKAGQVVMLGSVTPPVWLTGPGAVTVRFGDAHSAGLGAVDLTFR